MSSLACEQVVYRDVLRDVSLAVEPGRVLGLLGPSGVGKTTLLWVLAGLIEPDSGGVKHKAGKIGMVFQQPGLWDHLTVEQHMKLVGAKPDVAERVIGQMRLTELRKRKPSTMSGGERQRLSIARALAVEPAWLLLDEPLAHLDGPTRQELFGLLREILKETRAGVILATHQAQEALRLCDRLAVMVEGKIAQQGSAEEVYRNPVDLRIARMTGEAGEFDGRIVRPEQVRFTPDAQGDSVVESCEYLGDQYLLSVRTGGALLRVYATTAIAVGTRGRVGLKAPVT